MNGLDSSEESVVIDRRPIVTCAGELEVFSSIEDALAQSLPQDTCEWRRSLGRPVQFVKISANFAPFTPAALPKSHQWDLFRQPIFHIYWTECSDIDAYKTTVKDDIESWLKEITSKDISDWLIVVVENYDGKRANKLLPRTTVWDKVRADFASKQGDRCISVINPGRPESRSADSWRGLLTRIRQLLLIAYAKAITKLEDYVRHQRERRNEPGWDFMEYFALQEELAQVLEMLGLYNDALVQYDELDALFSQFVLNASLGTSAVWLSKFQKSLERWHSLKLGSNNKLHKDPSLLELRAYMYARQAQMLVQTDRVWEMVSRCLPFLHACVREMVLLEINAIPGALACWLYLACMEVLQTCEQYNQAEHVESYSAHTADLWYYASQKIRELGELCGLMPGQSPTSEQLHMVVGLSAGIGDSPGTNEKPSPTDKLKEALSSQDAFRENYLGLAELAVGTYKHISRLRSARLVGREVASFYLLLGETQKAAAFLNDALKTFQQDGWLELSAQTQLELADCYKKAGDVRKFLRACASVSAAAEIDNLVRWTYFDEMLKNMDSIEKPVVMPFENIMKVIGITVKDNGSVMQDTFIEIELEIDSGFPREIVCTYFGISLETDCKDKRKVNNNNNSRILMASDLKERSLITEPLKIQRHMDYRENKQLASASVVCRSMPLKRKDSNQALVKGNFANAITLNKLPLVLSPGLNVIRLTKDAKFIGRYYLGQISISVNKLELISNPLVPKYVIEVRKEEPSVRLDKGASSLLSGFEQFLHLTITIGSYEVNPNSVVRLSASRGLTMKRTCDDPLVSSVEIAVTDSSPFSSTKLCLRVLSELNCKEHQITIITPWSSKPLVVSLSFVPPFSVSWRLHTVKHRKFVHLTVTGQCDHEIEISNPSLNVNNVGVRSLNCSESSSQKICNGVSITYMWELLITANAESLLLKNHFSIQYNMVLEDENNSILDSQLRTYSYYFNLTNYQTLYVIEASIQPSKGSEFCRVGVLCHLNLIIKPAGHILDLSSIESSVMYEVLAEQSIWAVCGRTAGVISFESGTESQVVVLDVMPLNTGYLPLPLIRLSKYITAESDKTKKGESHPRLEPFSPGQVYNSCKGQQVHVIAALSEGSVS